MSEEKIYLTGSGIINPAGNNIEEFWNNLLKGKSFIESLDIKDDTPVKVGARVKSFNPCASISKRIVVKTDIFTHYFLAAISEAMKKSGLVVNEENNGEIGIFFGNNSGGWNICERGFEELFQKDYSLVNPWQATAWFPTAGQGYASIIYGIKGYSKTFVADRVSGAAAFYHAIQSMECKRNRKVLIGGSEAPLTGLGTICYNENGSISQKLSEYVCRPFSKKSEGIVLGEGGAAVVLETSMEEKNFVEVAGYATNYVPSDQVNGVVECMKYALRKARVTVEEIDLIIPEGNGDCVSDSIEKKAILELFKEYSNKIPILLSKFYFAHQYGAALIADIICASMAIKSNEIPKYPYISDIEEYFTDKPNKKINNVLINSRTSSGINYTFILKRIEKRSK